MNADTVWLEQDPSMAHAVRLHRGNTHTTLYRWSEVNAVIKAHGPLIKGAELINKYAPPRHNDGDVWLAQDPTMAHAVRVYRQLPGGDESHQCLYSWADVNDVLRRNKVVEGAELINKYAPPRHNDGDVWLEQDPSMPHALRLYWQQGGREIHQCQYNLQDAERAIAGRQLVAGAEHLDRWRVKPAASRRGIDD